MSYLQALILGLVQGVSELFPISSLGHSVVLPRLLGWQLDQRDPSFVSFLVATHTATAVVLLGFFWRDWVRMLRGVGGSIVARRIAPENVHGRVGWLLVIGTVPAGLLGLLLQDPLQRLFASPRFAAAFLALNGVLLYAGERLRRRAPRVETALGSDERLARMHWWQSLMVGSVQALALIPGLSRSGSAMAGGLLVGLSNEDAARFAFLLATPIIGAAGALKLPMLFAPANHSQLGPALTGALGAGVTAYLAVKFLLRYFETRRLTPFAVYCAAVGTTLTLVFLVH
jgi:undecaprenyl-diphosphatase